MGDRPISPGGLRFHSDGRQTDMIQRTPVVECKLRIRKYENQVQSENQKGKEGTHLVHHHCKSVDVCLLGAVHALQAELLWKEQFGREPTN